MFHLHIFYNISFQRVLYKVKGTGAVDPIEHRAVVMTDHLHARHRSQHCLSREHHSQTTSDCAELSK
jgi:hypothetical protein